MMKDVKHPLTLRQRQALLTRELVLAAARELFLTQGYGTTTIEEISAKAGVAVSTVYNIYKNKRGVLSAIREAWHLESGQRDIYVSALQESHPPRRMELAARATRRQWETGASMIAIYTSASAIDAEAAAELNKAITGRRTALTRFIDQSASMLRHDLDQERATAIYLALTRVEVYRELVLVFGWSPDDYEAWLAETLKQQLLP